MPRLAETPAQGDARRARLTALPGGRSAPVVREMRREDVPEAAAVFADTMRSTPPGTDAQLAAFFERTLFDCPWATPDIPSLVAEEPGGGIVGMMGTQTRRLRMGERELRLSCLGFFAVHPSARGGAIALELMRKGVGGAQDADVTDSASVVVERLAIPRLGVRSELRCVHWVRAWRPAAVVEGFAPVAIERWRARPPVRLLGHGVDRGIGRACRSLLAPPPVDTVAVPLTPEHIVEHQPGIVGDQLHVAYDLPYLRWLFAELGRAPGRGQLIAHLISDPGGRVLGWYVYFLRERGRSEVMQVVARERDLGAVLDHLLRHAWEHGTAMLRGRVEPGRAALVARRRCMLWYRGGAIVRADEPEITEALQRQPALSRLDNEFFSDTLV
jgi:predicted N-acetyltransferase YhbS